MAKYFTIKTFSSVGVGDQLGTQFARLFLIGEAIGATYLHTPLEIQGSAESNFRRRIRSFFFFLKKILINFPVQHKSIALIAKSFNPAERIISRLDRTDINGPITPFLSEIIKKVSTKEELIASLKWQCSEHESIVLEWTPELYPYCYKLDDLFNSGKTINFNQFLNKAFWKNKNKDAPIEEKLFVVHQRCGDSVTLLSDAGKVVIYGNEVTFDNEDTEQFDLNNDKNRVGRAVEMYVEVLQELKDLRGSGTKIVFISDGYQTSKNILKTLATI